MRLGTGASYEFIDTVESVFDCFRSGNGATHRVKVQIAEIKNNPRFRVKTK